MISPYGFTADLSPVHVITAGFSPLLLPALLMILERSKSVRSCKTLYFFLFNLLGVLIDPQKDVLKRRSSPGRTR
jgi:hypothetical protein